MIVGAKHNARISIALILTLALGLLGRGDWLHQVLSLGALLWLGVPLLVTAGFLIFKRQTGIALSCVGLAGVIALQLGVGIGVLHWDIHRSQRYCESLVPILDDIYHSDRRYPLTLAADSRLPPPPSWQFDTELINYYSDGASFAFEITNPAEIFAGFVYRHDSRHWEEWRD